MIDRNKILKKYDYLLCLIVIFFTIATAIQKLYFENMSLAIVNFVVSLIPAIYLIFSNFPKSLNKKMIYPIVIIFIRILTSIISFNKLDNYSIIIQLCYDISLIFNITSIYLVIFKLNITREFDFKYINYALIVSTFAYSVYNIISNIESFAYFTNTKFMSLINFSSFFNNRNLFGEMLLLALFATYYQLNKKKTKLLIFMKYLFMFNIVLTLSRNAILSFIVFFILKSIFEKKYKVIALIIILISLIMLTNILGIREMIFNYVIRSDAMTSGRTTIWKLCLEKFMQSPIIGYGELYISNVIDDITGVTSMHSWFFKILLNGGILNVIMYICVIYKSLITAWGLRKSQHKHSNLIFPMIISLLVYGVFEEINLFEFGLINMCITFYFVVLPSVLYAQERKLLNGEN